MDFTLNEEQAAIAELAGQDPRPTSARPTLSRAHEGAGGGAARRPRGRSWPRPTCSAWPARVGRRRWLRRPRGVRSIAEQVGRHVAPVPYASDHGRRRSPWRPRAAHDALLAERRRRPGRPRRRRRRGRRLGHRVPRRVRHRRGRRSRRARRFVPWAPVADAHRWWPPAPTAASVELFLVRPGTRRDGHRARTRCGACPRRRVELAGGAGHRRLGGADGRRSCVVEVATALDCATVAGVCEGATAHHGGVRVRARAVRARRSARSRRSASAWPTPTSTPRACGSRRQQAAWRLADGPAAPTTSCTSPSSGPPTAATGSSTPPSTSTAASASTSTTRSTATSGGSRCSSCSSAPAPSTCASLGAVIAAEPV